MCIRDRYLSSSVNSILLQVVLISIAIATSSFVVINYPEPKPPEPDLLPMHSITIETWTNDKNIDEAFTTTSTPGINIVFYFWNDVGATDSIAVTGTTNGTGMVTVLLEEGTYDMKVGEWSTETLDIFENITIVVHRYDYEIIPDSIDINALSADWQVTSDDIIFVKYSSTFEFEVNLDSIKMSGLELDSIACELTDDAEAAVPVGGADLYAADANCELDEPLFPFASWSDGFRIPAGITIPWSVAKTNPEVVLNISYVEMSVDE